MPDGERCRRAVCGRTARTVRQGAAGEAPLHARDGRETFGPASGIDQGTTNNQRPTSPIYCFADATGECLAELLRPGNAGANTIADHVTVLDAAMAQLPDDIAVGHRVGDDPALVRRAVQVRTDSAGCTGFVWSVRT